MTGDPFNLERFVAAQRTQYANARSELERGRKTSHWIWFIFPQLKGLGVSERSSTYGIGSLDEAKAYLAHPELGSRLAELTRLVLAHRDKSLNDIFGAPDDLKFRSSMTLFAKAAGPASVFGEALDVMCAGEPDPRTIALLDEPDKA